MINVLTLNFTHTDNLSFSKREIFPWKGVQKVRIKIINL
jgi:hypothetical protein